MIMACALVWTALLCVISVLRVEATCGWDAPNRLLCQPQFLDGNFGGKNFLRRRIMSLTIRCQNTTALSHITNSTFDGLPHLSELVVEGCSLQMLPAVFGSLSKLTSLTVKTYSSAGLQIEAGTFDQLQSLQQLDLSSNGLQNLANISLCRLQHLKHLNLSSNRFEDIDGSVFGEHDVTAGCPVPSLSSMDLSDNFISFISHASLAHLSSLEEIIMSGNQLELIESGSFHLFSLQHIDLSNNKLSTLPDGVFQNTGNLRRLLLNNNYMKSLRSSCLRGLHQLEHLDLSGNDLTSTWVNSQTFMGLSALTLLDLSHNQFSQIDPSIFSHLVNLNALQLHHNQLDNLPPAAFSSLSQLHTLVISDNNLHRIDSLSMQGMDTLRKLDLSNNLISYIENEAFANKTSMEELLLNNNKLGWLPEYFGNLTSLKLLNFNNNLIEKVSGYQFLHMNSLLSLNMDDNLLGYISKNTFSSVPQLKIICLSRNRIRFVEPGIFNENRFIEAIRLDANQLTSVNNLFSGLNQLRWLNASDNRIESLDYSMLPASIQWLDLHKNDISDLTDHHDTADSIDLRTLDLSFNKLTSVNGKSLPRRVEYLLLNDNQLTSVEHYTFFLLSNLSRVDLYANQLQKIDINALRLNTVDYGHSTPEFYIGGNPFVCDCEMEWLYYHRRLANDSNYPRIVDLESVYCRLVYHRDRSYVPLVEADASMFLCPYDRHCFATCHCCEFDACDCEMTCPDKCSCYHDQSWSTNIIDCSNSQLENIPDSLPMDATDLYLDGNRISNISSLAFLGRKNIRAIHLNNSQVETVQEHAFAGLPNLKVLHLDSNYITEINGSHLMGPSRLKELYMQNNRITNIINGSFQHLHELEVLRLDDNMLSKFHVCNFDDNPALVEIGLSGNPWSCECNFVESFKDWLAPISHRIRDADSLTCRLNEFDSAGFSLLEADLVCHRGQIIAARQDGTRSPYFSAIVSVLLIACLVSCVTVVLFVFRSEIRAWVYSKCGVRICYRSAPDEEDGKPFDAFISYSEHDSAFVHYVLAPKLESGDLPYRLALLHRDFPYCDYLVNAIMDSVHSSQRTILVLSKNFAENELCRFQFKSAHHEVLKDNRKRLIVILLGDITLKDLDPELRLYLKSESCISWDDKQFLDKLRFAMPSSSGSDAAYQPHSHYSEIYETK